VAFAPLPCSTSSNDKTVFLRMRVSTAIGNSLRREHDEARHLDSGSGCRQPRALQDLSYSGIPPRRDKIGGLTKTGRALNKLL
jgi:hypothetical protein